MVLVSLSLLWGSAHFCCCEVCISASELYLVLWVAMAPGKLPSLVHELSGRRMVGTGVCRSYAIFTGQFFSDIFSTPLFPPYFPNPFFYLMINIYQRLADLH